MGERRASVGERGRAPGSAPPAAQPSSVAQPTEGRAADRVWRDGPCTPDCSGSARASGPDYAGRVTQWALASDLDRVDHHRRSTSWVAGLWRSEDARLLKLDAG